MDMKTAVVGTCLFFGTVMPALADPNIQYSMTNPTVKGYDRLDFPITVNAAPFTGRNYYFALHDNFISDGSMYIGLQPREPGKNLVIFSTFGTGTTALSSNCNSGADGGSGTSCALQYDWKLNTPYTLTMLKDTTQSTDNFSVWAGYIQDMITLESIEIGRFSVPAAREGLTNAPYHFNEYFPFNGAQYKDPTTRPCVEYTKLRVDAPVGYVKDQKFFTTKVSVRQDTGKDSCAIAQNTNNNRVTPIPGTFNYITETGILSK